jgi:hypothetical protein
MLISENLVDFIVKVVGDEEAKEADDKETEEVEGAILWTICIDLMRARRETCNIR